ncbi:cation:proton antiporter [Cellulomonas hominis]
MDLLTVGVVGAIAVVLITALAPKAGVAAPLLLVALGVAVSLVPAVPAIEIEPELILAGVLPPLLYATSVGMPTMDFRRDLTAISGLSVVLVVLTSVGLGFLFDWLIPGVGLPTGIALGAILSPTDAVATSIVRRLGVSPRVVTVLEGESLLNDASALVLLRSAVAATAASVSLWGVAGDFVFAVVVAVAIGALVGKGSLFLRARLGDAHLNTAVSFIVPFVAYLPAEHLGASGLVATVAAGLVAGSGSAKYLRPQDRLTEAANWRTLELLLEGAVFLLMGLELYGLVTKVRYERGNLLAALGLGALAIVVVLVVRTAYLAFLLRSLSVRARRGATVRGYLTEMGEKADDLGTLTRDDMARMRLPGRPPEATEPEVRRQGAPVPGAPVPDRDGRGRRGRGDQESRMQRLRQQITRRVADIDYLQAEPLGVREGAVLVWAGMRGVVTLAAAQSLPEDTPHRALLVLIAFTVAAGTLLLQGGTLSRLVRRLGLGRGADDGAAERARLAEELTAAAVAFIESPDLRRADGSPFDDAILVGARRLVQRDRADIEAPGTSDAQDVGVEDEPGIDGPGAPLGTPPETDRSVLATLHPQGGSAEQGDARAQVRELRLALLQAQREALLRIRDLGTSSSAALTSALAVLDADQISVELRTGE